MFMLWSFSLLIALSSLLLCKSLKGTCRFSIRKNLMSTATSIQNKDIGSLLKEAISKFLIDDPQTISFTPTSGGVNNIVSYVETKKNEKYVLRVYNNGNNFKRVLFEHAILDKLKSNSFSFQIPTTLPNLVDGKSHISLSNGAEASLFKLIPGSLPKLSKIREIGYASGELNYAMSKIQGIPIDSCPTPPYYELFKVHHAVSRESFFAMMASTTFDSVRKFSNILVQEILEIEDLIGKLSKNLKIPKQFIHGDLHYDNVLVVENKVSGLLDFEFCSYDWRAMELAVCLSKYSGEKDAFNYFESFVDGFAQLGELNEEEIEVIADLINLRILSNVVYFVGRALGDEDSIDSLITRAETYSNRVLWVKSHKKDISTLILDKFKTLKKL